MTMTDMLTSLVDTMRAEQRHIDPTTPTTRHAYRIENMWFGPIDDPQYGEGYGPVVEASGVCNGCRVSEDWLATFTESSDWNDAPRVKCGGRHAAVYAWHFEQARWICWMN